MSKYEADLRMFDDFIRRALPGKEGKIILKWSLKDKMGACGILGRLSTEPQTLIIANACLTVCQMLGGDIQYLDKRLHIIINGGSEH